MNKNETLEDVTPFFEEPNCDDYRVARKGAFDKFRDWANDENSAVIDLETTSRDGEAFEVSIRRVRDGVELIHFISFTDAEITGKALDYHRHRIKEIRKAPPREQFIDKLREVALSHRLLAYGAPFDQTHLFKTYGIYKQIECVMDVYAIINNDWSDRRGSYRWAKLINACIDWGVYNGNDGDMHTASVDTDMSVKLVQVLSKGDRDSD